MLAARTDGRHNPQWSMSYGLLNPRRPPNISFTGVTLTHGGPSFFSQTVTGILVLALRTWTPSPDPAAMRAESQDRPFSRSRDCYLMSLSNG